MPRYPEYTPREKALIRLLIRSGAQLSPASIAQLLNIAYPDDNRGCRGRGGVIKAIRRMKLRIPNA
jgi:hypothetical protein